MHEANGRTSKITLSVFYGNPNVTKLSKFKLKGVKAQILHMEGCKRSKLQTQGCKSTALYMKGAKGQTCKLKSCGWHIKLLL